MKKQYKLLLGSLGTVGIIAGATIGGVSAYGKHSDDAKGWELKGAKSTEGNFRLGNNYSKEYDYAFIDNTGEVNKKIGKYIPPKTNGNNNEYGIVKDSNGTLPVEDFINSFRKKHFGLYPLFKVKTSFFTFDNRYLTAVSADDWAKFIKWYVGDSKTPGHLSYGPEAGVISTFQIIPGVEDKGGSITLGGYANINKERGTITFYPDAFFGTFPIFSPYTGGYSNRLASYFINQNKDFTIEEIKTIISIFNKINNVNKNNAKNVKNKLDSDIHSLKDIDESRVKNLFSQNGMFSPNILALEPSKRVVVNGKSVQKYRILLDFFTAKENDKNKKSLLEKVAAKFPEVLTSGNGYYIDQADDGTYTVKNGPNKFYSSTKRIGMAQILSVINSDFKGFGIDFLKYVSIHEYGHHETLINAKDVSEGGVIASMINSKQAPNISSLANIDILNDYLDARTSGIKVKQVNSIGKPVNKATNEKYSTDFKFVYPNGHIEENKDIVGDFTWNNQKKVWEYNKNYKQHRAFQNSLRDLENNFLKPKNIKSYEAFIMNSFDQISGTMNPSLPLPSYHKKYVLGHDSTLKGAKLLNNINAFWDFLDRNFYSNFSISNYHFDINNGGYNFYFGSYSKALLLKQFTQNWGRNDTYDYKDKSGNKINAKDTSFTIDANDPKIVATLKLFKARIARILYEYKITGKLLSSLTAWKNYFASELTILKSDINNLSKEDIVKKVFAKYFEILLPKEQNGSELGFYDKQSHGWVSIAKAISKIKDKSLNKILISHTGTGSPDIDIESLYNYHQIGSEATKFDLIDPSLIKIKGGETYENFVNKNRKNKLDKKHLKQKFVVDILIPLLNRFFSIDWSVGTVDHNSRLPIEQGKRPQVTDMKFSDYVYQYPEVMTRDFVQITLSQDDDEQLSNTGDFLSLTQQGTSFEYYIDKSLTKDYDPSKVDSHMSDDLFKIWAWSNKDLIVDKLNNEEKEFWKKYMYNQEIVKNSKEKFIFMSTNRIANNRYLAKTKILSNGYEADRQKRAALGWALYNDDGSPRTDVNNFKIRGPKGEAPTSWAEAYWFFLLKMRGIGNRTITGFYRDPDLDKIYMYGYLDKAAFNNANKPQYLAFKSKKTGNVQYERIYYGNNNANVKNPMNTLFYLKHQGAINSKHTLYDQGYVSWSTNRFAAGQYTSEELNVGEYEMYFVNKDKKRVNNKLSLGSRKIISENGKIGLQAPTKIEKKSDGSLIFKVQPRFNGA